MCTMHIAGTAAISACRSPTEHNATARVTRVGPEATCAIDPETFATTATPRMVPRAIDIITTSYKSDESSAECELIPIGAAVEKKGQAARSETQVNQVDG